MKNLNPDFEPLKRLKTLSDFFFIDLVEDPSGQELQLLTIKVEDNFLPLLERTFRDEIQPLLKRQLEGVVLPIDAILHKSENTLSIIYAHEPDWITTSKFAPSIAAWKKLATAMSDLKKQNRYGYYFSPESLEFNGEEIRLRFIGLFALMRRMGLCPSENLSPDLEEDSSVPKIQDDIWAFGHLMAITGTDADFSHFMSKACEVNRDERYANWLEVIAALNELGGANLTLIGNSKNTKQYTMQVIVKPCFATAFQPMLREMNEECHFLVMADLSESKGQIRGYFHTQNHSAQAFLDERNNRLFLDWNQHRSREKPIPSGAIPIDCRFDSMNSSTTNLQPLMEIMRQQAILKTNEGTNILAAGTKDKKSTLKKWKTMPEKEKEYIEEQALKLQYIERRPSKNNPENVVFQLSSETKRYPWDKIKRLKAEGVKLTIDESEVGVIQDYHPTERHLTLRDVKLQLEEIPESGELIQNVRQEVSQFKKQVEACTKFVKGDVLNPELTALLATPELIPAPNRLVLDDDAIVNRIYNSRLKSDPTQVAAVTEALHRKPLYLIQGPPGTGKTTVIVEMIQQIVKRQPDARILVTSQSNLAVDNVLERLPADILFMRLAANEDRIGEQLKAHSYDNKLREWIHNTRRRAAKSMEQRLTDNREKLKPMIRLYHKWTQLQSEKDPLAAFWSDLRKPTVPAYYRENMFKNAASNKAIQQVFEKQIGADKLQLISIQREWESYLDNALGDEKDARTSKLRDGSECIGLHFAYLKSINVIGATCIHIASMKYGRVNFQFDYVIMDESSKASPAEALVPINMGRNIILIGDHKQLPPVVTREEAVKKKVKEKLEDNGLDVDKEFGESMFEKIITTIETDPTKAQLYRMLDIQYRMPRQIGTIISKYFYNGKLQNPDPLKVPGFDTSKSHELKLTKATSMVFLSTSKEANPYDNGDKFARANQCNLKKIKDALNWLNKAYPDNLHRKNEKGEPAPLTIGIIAGYRGQVSLLQRKIQLSKYKNFVTKDENGEDIPLIRINTVDKFQGAEEDIIIYDVVKSSRGSDTIGFLSDYRRVNVALSRVKRLLIVVGDSEYLLKRATLPNDPRFPEFKLKMIAEEFERQGLIIHQMEVLQPQLVAATV